VKQTVLNVCFMAALQMFSLTERLNPNTQLQKRQIRSVYEHCWSYLRVKASMRLRLWS